MQDDGKILCHNIKQETIKEIACVDDEFSCINLKKDLIIWDGDDMYEDYALPNIVRY